MAQTGGWRQVAVDTKARSKPKAKRGFDCPLRGCSAYGAHEATRCSPGFCGLRFGFCRPEPGVGPEHEQAE